LLIVCAGTCSPEPDPDAEGPCAAAGISDRSHFPTGSADGHPDPFGARAARQARASRIADPSWIRQPEDRRSQVRVGDFILLNEKVAFYIEGARLSDGYSSLGGELLAIDRVGEDGRPLGRSQYNETLLVLSRQAPSADSVTVLNDGSDGKAAVVRVAGRLTNVPFLDTFSGIFSGEYNYPAALDYILEPGAERLRLRLSLMNHKAEAADFDGFQSVGFFQSSRSRLFTAGAGYGDPAGHVPWVVWDNDGVGFAFRVPGNTLKFLLSVSGFTFLQPKGLAIQACQRATYDYAEFIAGGPTLDQTLAVLRRTDGDTSWREVRGTVRESGAGPIAGALVHLLDENGKYLTRTVSDRDGAFVLHAPPRPTRLVATFKGYDTPQPLPLAGDQKSEMPIHIDLTRPGTIAVRATDRATGQGIPVRVQVIPATPPAELPPAMGVPGERNGRLWQHFSPNGEARLAVPAGQHRVIVSRGFEWELFDQTVTVTAGRTTNVDAALVHSVQSPGVMCADFHIHSFFSADSSDPVDYKVLGAVADGLEIPVSSEHEWIIDFQPVIKKLGLERHAFGVPSEEFTTFTWGHFGIIPIRPRPDRVNNGAITWIGRKPAEVFQEIHELPEKPVLIVNHPSGGGFGAYFSMAGFERATASGDPELWSDRFEAVEVFNDSDLEANRNGSVADWFALLNAGKVAWAVGSSDSHSLRGTPVGYPRTCMVFGHDDPTRLTAEAVRDVLARGNAVVSGGLYMEVEGPGGTRPGAMLPPQAGPREFKVTVQAPSWLEATTLEVIVDGETDRTVQLRESAGGPGTMVRKYEAAIAVTPKRAQGHHFVVFHASAARRDLAPVAPGRRPFAVSNPIFF
jgi:hypothetical protein